MALGAVRCSSCASSHVRCVGVVVADPVDEHLQIVRTLGIECGLGLGNMTEVGHALDLVMVGGIDYFGVWHGGLGLLTGYKAR